MRKDITPDRLQGRIIPPRILLPLVITGIIIIITSAFLEYRSRRSDYLNMLEKRAALLINTILNTAQNTFNAAIELENEINGNIYSKLNLIERIDRNSAISTSELNDILSVSGIDEIQFYDENLRMVKKSFSTAEAQVSIPQNILQRVLRDGTDETLYVIPDTVRYEEDYLAAVVPRKKGGAVAGIINSERIRYFRRVFGFGQILKSFTEGEGIEYIVLENEQTIIAGFFQGYTLSPLVNDPFLRDAFNEELIKTRIIEYERVTVFEAVGAYLYDGEPVGLLRTGISMDELEIITARAKRRMFIFSSLLIVVGLVFVNFIVSYRHRQLLRKELSYLSVYTNTILDHLESGVITINKSGEVKVVNRQASQFIGINYADIYNKPYTILPEIFTEAIENCRKDSGIFKKQHYYQLPASQEAKWLSIRTTLLKEEKETYILLVDDMTEQVELEEQKRMNEKLSATRRLASGVAHEIRNPLNSIRLVIDLLKDIYIPAENSEKYQKYITSVQGEIDRVNGIIEEFLRFARPPELHPESIKFTEFFSDIEILYKPRLNAVKISLTMDIQQHPDYNGDPEQLKQLFVNLMENAIQSFEMEGNIEITGIVEGDYYEISFRDKGRGISSDNIKNIFELYYTTKKKGSGIGLAIVEQIVTRHNGTIKVVSEEGAGTDFIIRLPFQSEFKQNNHLNTRV